MTDDEEATLRQAQGERLSHRCRVELYGVARLTAGLTKVDVQVPNPATAVDVTSALALACPQLVGSAITSNGGLMKGHVLNVNGRSFVDRMDAPIFPGDHILLLSDQAGG